MMSETESSSRSTTPLQGNLARISDMLDRDRSIFDPAERDSRKGAAEDLERRRNLAELQREIDALHPADVAHILDALPPEDRLSVWNLVKADRDGEILLEVSDSVRESLLADMDAPEILAAAEQLDADELADLAEDLPDDVVHELMQRLDAPEREQLRSAMSYEDYQVGAIMDFEMITIREDVTLEVVLRYLRFSRDSRADRQDLRRQQRKRADRRAAAEMAAGKRSGAEVSAGVGPSMQYFSTRRRRGRNCCRRSSAMTWFPRRWSTTMTPDRSPDHRRHGRCDRGRAMRKP